MNLDLEQLSKVCVELNEYFDKQAFEATAFDNYYDALEDYLVEGGIPALDLESNHVYTFDDGLYVYIDDLSKVYDPETKKLIENPAEANCEMFVVTQCGTLKYVCRSTGKYIKLSDEAPLAQTLDILKLMSAPEHFADPVKLKCMNDYFYKYGVGAKA